jgi:hypothetical protein
LAEPTFRLLPIRATAFQNVLSRLGAAPNMGGFALDTIVTPVSLVDSDITLNAAASTPLVNVPASAGELVAPAANTRLATTGPLPAGPYTMVFWFGCTEGATTTFRIRRRNAGDTADIWSHRFAGSGAAPPFYSVALRLLLALNEFVTVENPSAGGVGSIYQGTIFFTAG